MKAKNLAVLSQPAVLSGQRERIKQVINRASEHAVRRYHLWICAVTGMRMSRREAVRGGASVTTLSLALITAECLPLCVLFLMLSALLSQPWRR